VLPFFLLLILLEIHQLDGTNVTFVPKPIRITVNDLPRPYVTVSVSKSANVISVPEDPHLYVPDGFIVKLYMSGLTSPCYLMVFEILLVWIFI
jgi:hypothetical protein